MSRVCQIEFPKGTYHLQRADGFWMNQLLKANLDALLANAGKGDDWDFVFIITGGGRVRVGKSLLAMQIAKYWVSELKRLYGIETGFNEEDNIVFHGSKLIEKGHNLAKKYSQGVLIFDEAGADLEGVKVMKKSTQAVKDYLRECGQYNFLTILVLPEYFDLPRGIAITRSDCLIDVSRSVNQNGKFIRGFFKFYSWPTKRQLYIRGKKDLNYRAWKYDFQGRFFKFYPIDEQKYRDAKARALLSRKEEGDATSKEVIWKRRSILSWIIAKEHGISNRELSRSYRKHNESLSQTVLSGYMSSFTKKMRDDSRI